MLGLAILISQTVFTKMESIVNSHWSNPPLYSVPYICCSRPCNDDFFLNAVGRVVCFLVVIPTFYFLFPIVNIPFLFVVSKTLLALSIAWGSFFPFIPFFFLVSTALGVVLSPPDLAFLACRMGGPMSPFFWKFPHLCPPFPPPRPMRSCRTADNPNRL